MRLLWIIQVDLKGPPFEKEVEEIWLPDVEKATRPEKEAGVRE